MKDFPSSILSVIAASVILFASGAYVDARAVDKKDSMELRVVMDRLGRDMQAVVGAISNEDWTRVEALSARIAGHAEPSAMEKVRILKWVGTDVGKFRTFDAEVKQRAKDMAEAAGRGDGPRVIGSFSKVQNACLGCHQQFRTRFVGHFYDRR